MRLSDAVKGLDLRDPRRAEIVREHNKAFWRSKLAAIPTKNTDAEGFTVRWEQCLNLWSEESYEKLYQDKSRTLGDLTLEEAAEITAGSNLLWKRVWEAKLPSAMYQKSRPIGSIAEFCDFYEITFHRGELAHRRSQDPLSLEFRRVFNCSAIMSQTQIDAFVITCR